MTALFIDPASLVAPLVLVVVSRPDYISTILRTLFSRYAVNETLCIPISTEPITIVVRREPDQFATVMVDTESIEVAEYIFHSFKDRSHDPLRFRNIMDALAAHLERGILECCVPLTPNVTDFAAGENRCRGQLRIVRRITGDAAASLPYQMSRIGCALGLKLLHHSAAVDMADTRRYMLSLRYWSAQSSSFSFTPDKSGFSGRDYMKSSVYMHEAGRCGWMQPLAATSFSMLQDTMPIRIRIGHSPPAHAVTCDQCIGVGNDVHVRAEGHGVELTDPGLDDAWMDLK